MSSSKVNPLVSTIIPVLNRKALLAESVNSVLGQTYRPIEIIIVDDGSEAEYAQYYIELAHAHAEITVIHQQNQGPGLAREAGRQAARGEFIQYLDSDDLLTPNKFEAQVRALHEHTTAHASYGPCVEVERSDNGIKLSDPSSWATLSPMRLTGTPMEKLFPATLRERWWITSAPLYRRNVLEQAGPWLNLVNEEDWEYDARVASLGGALCYVPEVVSVRVLHDAHLSDGGSANPLKLRDRCAARLAIYASARRYERDGHHPSIGDKDWRVFSQYAFLLARQCAAVGLVDEYRALVKVSIDAVGGKTAKHRLFMISVALLGAQRAAALLQALGK